jgi:hypothetical protein
MKRYLVGVLLLVSLSTCSPTVYSQQSDSEKRDLKLHKVKRVTSVVYFYDSEGHQSSITNTFTDDYDKNGNLAKRIGYDFEGKKPTLEWTYEYDDRNNMINSIFDNRLLGRSEQKSSYQYDKGGHIVEAIAFEVDGRVKEKGKYKYDQSGHQIQTVTYDPADNVTATYKQKYDSKGTLIETDHFSSGGDLIEKTVLESNDKGNLTQTVVYDSKDRVSEKTVEKYSEDGDYLVEEIQYDGGGHVKDRTVTKRDANGFAIEKSKYDANDKLVQLTKLTWEFYQ